MKKENCLWGGKRIHGELLKLGFRISESSVRNILRSAGFDPVDPVPEVSWKEFISRHKKVWAVDFFHVETAFLKTLSAFVVTEIHSRRLLSLTVTIAPNPDFVAQHLQSLIMTESTPELIIRDRDGVYGVGDLERSLCQQGVRVLKTPVRSPQANAYAERLIGSVRRECTDHFLFLNDRQLQKVLDEYRCYYNDSRPHQGIGQRIPGKRHDSKSSSTKIGTKFLAREKVFGLHHSYLWAIWVFVEDRCSPQWNSSFEHLNLTERIQLCFCFYGTTPPTINREQPIFDFSKFFVVSAEGLEPSTHALKGRLTVHDELHLRTIKNSIIVGACFQNEKINRNNSKFRWVRVNTEMFDWVLILVRHR